MLSCFDYVLIVIFLLILASLSAHFKNAIGVLKEGLSNLTALHHLQEKLGALTSALSEKPMNSDDRARWAIGWALEALVRYRTVQQVQEDVALKAFEYSDNSKRLLQALPYAGDKDRIVILKLLGQIAQVQGNSQEAAVYIEQARALTAPLVATEIPRDDERVTGQEPAAGPGADGEHPAA